MKSIKTNNFVEKLFEQSSQFVLVGLTGKVRSGTSDVAALLTSENFSDSITLPVNTSGFEMSEIREFIVVMRYLQKNWKPFIELSVNSVIISFLLDSLNNEQKKNDFLKDKDYEDLVNVIQNMNNELSKKAIEKFICLYRALHFHMIENYKIEPKEKIIDSKLMEKVEDVCKNINTLDTLINEWNNVKCKIYNRNYTSFDVVIFSYCILPAFSELLEKKLEKKKYTQAFQKFGNNIRAYGECYCTNKNENDINAENLFKLPERLNLFIKMLRYFSKMENGNTSELNPIFVVINNFKNIFEAYYFRRRYSSFYLVAVSCDEEKRKKRFNDLDAYKSADLRENLSNAKKIYKSVGEYLETHAKNNDDDAISTICESLGIEPVEAEFGIEICLKDSFRKACYDNKYAPFVLQDIMTCIENSDIFVTRDFTEHKHQHDYSLIRSLARIVVLILHPGLLTPTKIERCMQIAITAKLNSGCLSRQVGAVVTDSEYNILSLGWNDAPCGVESCIRRNLFDLINKHDPEAYSEYELNDERFRHYLDVLNRVIQRINSKVKLNGLPGAFCFKDIYQDIIKQRDQIYTRALHAEERALASCGNDKTKGGYLFTTSSPCELCAKKSKEASISKIYYIEQYPGISHTHVIDAGPQQQRAIYEFFVGAIGLAYVKLYTPLIPYKDELAAIGFPPSDNQKKINDDISLDEKRTTTTNNNHIDIDTRQILQSPQQS